MVILGIANLSTLYYGENYWIVSDSSLESGKFVSNYAGAQSVYGNRLNVYWYFNQDIKEVNVHLFWYPGDYVPPGSLLVFDTYSNTSKYGPELSAMTDMYFGKTGDIVLYDNGPFKIHKITMP